MFKMTVEDAMQCQARDIKHYARYYLGGEPALRAVVNGMTTADQLTPGVMYPTTEINKHVPRGGSIEFLCGVDFGGN